MPSISNPFQACRDIILKPNGVFATLRTTDNWSWIPFLLIILASLAPIYSYFHSVDLQWYKELIIQSSAANISPGEQNFLRNSMTQTNLLWSTSIAIVFSLIAGNAILAGYLHICAKADEECVQAFTDWYGLTWWINLPSILTSLLALVIILLSQGGQLSPVVMNPASLAFLFSVSEQSPWYNLSQAIRLENIWMIYLIAVGLSQWTQFSKNRCYLIAILPFALIWLIWALLL